MVQVTYSPRPGAVIHLAAAREACRLVLRVLPRLVVAAVGAGDASIAVTVREGASRVVHVDHGTVVPTGDHDPPRDLIESEPVALLLLLTGRRDAHALHGEGTLDWSGPVADAVVRRTPPPARRVRQRPAAPANAG